MELDDALKTLGDFGCYQCIVYVLICLVGQLTQSWHMLASSFLGAVPDHHCHIPLEEGSGGSDGRCFASWSGDPSKFYPVESGGGSDGEDDDVIYSSCERYINSSVSNATEKCNDGWMYDCETYGSTIATKWQLVCEDGTRVDLSTSIFMAGVMVGSLLFGQLSDRFGRKPIWFVSIWAQIAFGVGVAFSPNYWTFVTLRFFVGVFEQGVDLTSYVMVSEMFTPTRRGPASILLTLFWAGGIMSLPGLAYLLKDWQYLQLAISLPNVLTVFIITIIPESTRWLLSRGKIEKAEENLQKVARFNGKDIPNPILTSNDSKDPLGEVQSNGTETFNRRTKINAKIRQISVTSDPEKYDGLNSDTKTLTLVEGYSINSFDAFGSEYIGEERHHTLLDLFRTRYIRKVTIIMIFVWFVNSVIYYGLSLNTDSLAGDPYLNFFLSGAVEIPAYIVSALLVRWVGRRGPLCVFHILGGLACIATAFIPEKSESGTDLSAVIITVAMVGKFCISASYAIVFLYATELFPTVVRNLGLGVSSFASRVGGIVAPLMLLLDQYFEWLPYCIFGGLSILAGFSVLPLPETLGRTQPQTVRNAEDLHRRVGSPNNTDAPYAAHMNLEDNDTRL